MAIGRQTLTILRSCTLRADTICRFGKLATNFFVQNCMLPCRAVTSHNFTGANIGVAFRSIITHTDGYIVVKLDKSLSHGWSPAHIEQQKLDRRSS